MQTDFYKAKEIILVFYWLDVCIIIVLLFI